MDVAIGEVLHDNHGNSLSSFIFFLASVGIRIR
jgi:hypothetical protein